ncbi:MAG TPA: ATP citrate lyase citrate-binding domain-containing protein [Candidatus Paceibacterota bacterium]
MKLFEYQGKELFRKYGIAVPGNEHAPFVVKAQVLSGDRMKAGLIKFAKDLSEVEKFKKELGEKSSGEVLVEENVPHDAEYYLSFSYDTDTRGPVMAYSESGGTDIRNAILTPIDILDPHFSFENNPELLRVFEKLWRLFISEYALLTEINPLVENKNGELIALDAKVILDDEKVNFRERRYIDMDGDIAVLASGGGASLLNLDALILAGAKPANYTEYSGNPPRTVVAELTKKVLSKKNIRGCWVVGGTANFTDIYETLSGFVDGLRQIVPKPKYPIVIRRDGPRQKEAVEMLQEVGSNEGFDFHIYGAETSMAETAKIVTKLSYGNPG